MLTVTYFYTWYMYIMYQYCNKEIVKWHCSYLEGSENFSLNFSVLSKLLKEDCVFISMDNWDIWNEGQILNRVLLQDYTCQQFITSNPTTTSTGTMNTPSKRDNIGQGQFHRTSDSLSVYLQWVSAELLL